MPGVKGKKKSKASAPKVNIKSLEKEYTVEEVVDKRC